MAEPLQTLFSHIRRPRQHRRMQWEPVAVQGGSSPGMRGTINPLDSVAMTDSAQGVDISSVVPPTRLASDRMGEAYQPQEEAAPEAASPFMFASQRGGTPAQPVSQGGVRYEKRCGPNGCQMVPVFDDMPAAGGMQMMQQNALPEGVVVNPGEQYVKDSLRVTTKPATASAPVASAAPAAAPQQPPPAAALPQEQPGPASSSRGLTPDAVREMFAPALAKFGEARSAASAREAVLIGNEATAMFRQAEIAVRILQADAIERKNDELERELKARGLALQNQKDPAYQQKQYEDAISNIRGQMGRQISDRASAVVEYKMMRTPNMKYEPQFVAAAVQQEEGVIFAMDAAKSWQSMLAQDVAASMATDPAEKELRELTRRQLEGQLVSSVLDRFDGEKDPKMLKQKIDASLRQPFYHASFEDMKGRGFPEGEARVQAAIQANDAIGHVYARVMDARSSGLLYLPSVSAPPPKPPQQAPASKEQELEPVRETNPLGFFNISPEAYMAAPPQPF